MTSFICALGIQQQRLYNLLTTEPARVEGHKTRTTTFSEYGQNVTMWLSSTWIRVWDRCSGCPSRIAVNKSEVMDFRSTPTAFNRSHNHARLLLVRLASSYFCCPSYPGNDNVCSCLKGCWEIFDYAAVNPKWLSCSDWSQFIIRCVLWKCIILHGYWVYTKLCAPLVSMRCTESWSLTDFTL